MIWGYEQAEEANVLKENEVNLLGGVARNKHATPRAWELLLSQFRLIRRLPLLLSLASDFI